MAELKFMAESEMDPKLVNCPHCDEVERLGIHSRKARIYKCHECGKTFSEMKGTVFANLHYPSWVVTVILTLLAYGCPLGAIVVAFMLDERTVSDWQAKAGQQGKRIQEEVVCNSEVELGQVQADELFVKMQNGKVWMATAMSVFSRLFIWGEVSPRRDKSLVRRLFDKVAQAAKDTTQPVLVAVDGFAGYPKAIVGALHTKLRNGRAGRPRHIPWPNIQIVQVVKTRQGRKLKEISRRLLQGTWPSVYTLIAVTQINPGKINTAYIERLNATFRARMPSLVRRTRNLARTTQRLEHEMFWMGAVYNFSTVHSSLDATPAMAAGLTDHIWSVHDILSCGGPRKSLHAIL